MSDLTEKTRCPFCDNDPFDYVDNGLGMVPVAVTCCHLGRDYWDDNGDEITKKAGDEITGSRVTIARLRSLYADLVEALEAVEALDWRDDCPECGGQDIPEICPLCFPKADAARLKRWDALAKVHGQTQAEWVAAMNAARAKADNDGET